MKKKEKENSEEVKSINILINKFYIKRKHSFKQRFLELHNNRIKERK